ncbi:ATP-binding protein [Candidatus Babeliales bacterium]|nr:ATP-binding protein [Candidatus Babeliales bacterium]MBP9843961.1 ATP-binding protein [Candidatus Babeliales bacterium]
MERSRYLELIQLHFRVHSVCAILGARQVGKTTLARQFAEKSELKVIFFDLEDPDHLRSLENPKLILSQYAGFLIIIDEIQRRPDLFPLLRVLVDDPIKKYKFLILGSASRDLIHQSSETLAGRIGYIELPPFTLFEVGHQQQLFLRGGFPRAFLAETDADSFFWLKDYINTFLERDLRMLGFQNIAPLGMYKFWMMLCFYHGQLANNAEISKSLMISRQMATRYLDILAGTFMIRVLHPWYENIQKRQIKTPKIYFRDSGIFNCLMSINSLDGILRNPKVGALWEGFALEQILNFFQIRSEEAYFWATHNEAELDLLIFKDGKRIGFEFKYADAPKITKSMHIALEDLKLDHLYVVYPGVMKYPMHEKITACSLDRLPELELE